MALKNTTKAKTYLPISPAGATMPVEPSRASSVMGEDAEGYRSAMSGRSQPPDGVKTGRLDSAEMAEYRLEKLILRLPDWAVTAIRHVRRPEARWFRLPIAFILVPGGLMGFLPVLGLWMLPLGLMLFAVDIPILRRQQHRLVNWLAERRPHWFQ